MHCYICGKVIIIKRTIKTLFVNEPSFRCNACKRRYKTLFSLQVIPKENGSFYIYSLFLEENDLNWLAFNEEVSSWFNEIKNKITINDYILWLNKIEINILENLDCLYHDVYILNKAIIEI